MLTLALLAPLTAGDYDLSVAATMTLAAMVLAILNVNHGWSIGTSILAALGVGARRRARERRARRAARHRLADRDARQLHVHRRDRALDQRLADDQRHLGRADRLGRREAALRDPARVLLRHRARARPVLRLRVHAGRAQAAVRRPRPQRGAPLRHPRLAPPLGRARRERPDQRVRRHPLRGHARLGRLRPRASASCCRRSPRRSSARRRSSPVASTRSARSRRSTSSSPASRGSSSSACRPSCSSSSTAERSSSPSRCRRPPGRRDARQID